MLGSPDTEFEKRAGYPESIVVGVDEVGRGCLAGPVVAGAVVLPSVIDWSIPWLSEITDSKLLTPKKRERLAPLIEQWAMCCSVGEATVEEIDRINILYASHLAMARAVEKLGVEPCHILVDGNLVPKAFRGRASAVVKGDQRCLSVACASVIAKVWRDSLMVKMDTRYPGYGFAIHKGYPTRMHNEALQRLGPSNIHRRSFRPVIDLVSATGSKPA